MMASLSITINYLWIYVMSTEAARRHGKRVSSEAPWRFLCLVTLWFVIPTMPLIYSLGLHDLTWLLWLVFLAPGLLSSFGVLANRR